MCYSGNCQHEDYWGDCTLLRLPQTSKTDWDAAQCIMDRELKRYLQELRKKKLIKLNGNSRCER